MSTSKNRSRLSNMLFLTVAVCCAIGSTTPIMGGIGEGNGEVGFDFGWTSFDDDVTDEAAGRFSIRGGFFISDLFQIEGESSASVAEEDDVDIALSTFFVNGVFNFYPSGRSVPYVRVGLGSAWLEFKQGNVTIDDSGGAFQLGVGSRFFFGKSKRAAFRVDLSGMRESTFDDNSTHVSLVVGFTWRIGAERPH